MDFKLKGADGMSNSLNGVGKTMGIIVHRINAPLIPGSMVSRFPNPIQSRIAHMDIRRSHIDPGPERFGTIRKFSSSHSGKQIKILFHRSISVRALLARNVGSATILNHLLRIQVTDERLALANQ